MAEVPKELEIPLRGGEEVSSTVEEAHSIGPAAGAAGAEEVRAWSCGPLRASFLSRQGKMAPSPHLLQQEPHGLWDQERALGWPLGIVECGTGPRTQESPGFQNVLTEDPRAASLGHRKGQTLLSWGSQGSTPHSRRRHAEVTERACGSRLSPALAGGCCLLKARPWAVRSLSSRLVPGAREASLWGLLLICRGTGGCAPHWP